MRHSVTAVALALLALGGCKKKGGVDLDAAPPPIGELPPGEGGWFEDEEASFRIHLPASPNLSEESVDRNGVPMLSRTAQIKEDDDELLVMWSELAGEPEGEALRMRLLTEVEDGWKQAGLQVDGGGPANFPPCTARALYGEVEGKAIDARLLVCDATLIQLVASGRFVPEAVTVFETFEWMGRP